MKPLRIVVLCTVGILLSLIAAGACPEDSTGSRALAYFQREVGKAAEHWQLSAPGVGGIYVFERDPRASALVIAYVAPNAPGFEPEIRIMWWALWAKNKRTLRCIARHEVAHIALGHTDGAHDEPERQRFEDQVNELLSLTWGEQPNCGLRTVKKARRAK